ncbi:hypothetical protein ACHAWF_016852 [Thalassiosira exigua]
MPDERQQRTPRPSSFVDDERCLCRKGRRRRRRPPGRGVVADADAEAKGRRLHGGGSGSTCGPESPEGEGAIPTARRRRSPFRVSARQFLFLACLSWIGARALVVGWSSPSAPSGSTARLIPPPQPLHWSSISHPSVRIKASGTFTSLKASRGSSQKYSAPSTRSKETKSNDDELPILKELDRLKETLIRVLHETSRESAPASTRPVDLLKETMGMYARWVMKDHPRPRLRRKASAAIDEAFRLVTNEAFSAPYGLSWVNLGLEALRLQLKPEEFVADFSSGNHTAGDSSGINGGGLSDGGSMGLLHLEAPYDAVPKGTWLKALRALTSEDLASSRPSHRSVRSLSSGSEARWTSPPDAAYHVLQRLVGGRGVRTWKKDQMPALDERDFNMVLRAYARSERFREMHAVLALQERTPQAPPLSAVAYSILLRAYGRCQDLKNVEVTLMMAERNRVVPDLVMANTALDAYIECGMSEKAEELMQTMTRNNNVGDAREDDSSRSFWPRLRPNSRTYNTLLKGMAQTGDVRSATKLAVLIDAEGLWDEVTTNTLVQAYVAGNDFASAEAILSDRTSSRTSSRRPRGNKDDGDHPNVEAYTELLDGYAKDGKLEDALRIMSVMERRGVSPNEYTYTCMVGALARNNRIRQARKMLAYATSSSPRGDGKGRRRRLELAPAYNAFVSGMLSDNGVGQAGQASHAANVIEALSALREMQQEGIHPNAATAALVVDGLGRCAPPRCAEARELVLRLEHDAGARRRGHGGYVNQEGVGEGDISLSNGKIATALIGAYGRANDFDGATEAFERIPSPDVVAFNAMLDACCRCDRLKMALELFKERASFERWKRREEVASAARSSGSVEMPPMIKPDVVTYTTLISALLQLKSRAATKRAMSMYEEMKRDWWISPDTVLVDAILTAMISGGPIGFEESDVKFTLSVLRDSAHLDWGDGQYEKRKRAVRGVLVGCSSEIWKKDEFAFGLVSEEPDDPLFEKKGWNKIDSGFRLWGGSGGVKEDDIWQQDGEDVDSFLASKGWNDIDSGFRLL